MSCDENCETCDSVRKFWEDYRACEDTLEHICEIDMDTLRKRHKHVLALIGKYNFRKIGTLLSARYYNVWQSRSCSGVMSDLVGGEDYLDFYCGSSDYAYLSVCFAEENEELLRDFEEADAKDREEYGRK